MSPTNKRAAELCNQLRATRAKYLAKGWSASGGLTISYDPLDPGGFVLVADDHGAYHFHLSPRGMWVRTCVGQPGKLAQVVAWSTPCEQSDQRFAI